MWVSCAMPWQISCHLPFQVDVSWNKKVTCKCQEKFFPFLLKTLVDVRDSILTYHIMVEYCYYFILWGLGM
jgi:hypothetical protein